MTEAEITADLRLDDPDYAPESLVLTQEQGQWLVAQLQQARQEVDATWVAIERGWHIESRAEMEQQSVTNGFRFGLAQAIHHIWKREPKVEQAEAALRQAHEALAEIRVDPTVARNWASVIDAALKDEGR